MKRLDGCGIVKFKNENRQHTPLRMTFDSIFSGFVLPCVDDKANAMMELPDFEALRKPHPPKPGSKKLLFVNISIRIISAVPNCPFP